MNRIGGFLTLAIMTSVGSIGAAELESGLQVGDYPDAFYVSDVTGPSAGEDLCYKCQYGARPVVSIFARAMDDHVRSLIKQIDDVVGQHYEEERMAAFVVLLTDQPKDDEKILVAAAKEHKISFTPLTTYNKSSGPRKYRIHEDAAVTVMMWVDNDVKSNHTFAKGKLTDDAIKQVVAATATILK
jgi:hypothetical protein